MSWLTSLKSFKSVLWRLHKRASSIWNMSQLGRAAFRLNGLVASIMGSIKGWWISDELLLLLLLSWDNDSNSWWGRVTPVELIISESWSKSCVSSGLPISSSSWSDGLLLEKQTSFSWPTKERFFAKKGNWDIPLEWVVEKLTISEWWRTFLFFLDLELSWWWGFFGPLQCWRWAESLLALPPKSRRRHLKQNNPTRSSGWHWLVVLDMKRMGMDGSASRLVCYYC